MSHQESPDPEEFLPLPPRDFQVLMILLRGPLHAYGLSVASEEDPRGAVRLEIGSLYRMLARMLGAGLIDEVEDAAAERGATARRSYRITELGRRAAEAEAMRLAEVLEVAREARLLPGSTS